jgi:hypothetical protein
VLYRPRLRRNFSFGTQGARLQFSDHSPVRYSKVCHRQEANKLVKNYQTVGLVLSSKLEQLATLDFEFDDF